MVHYLWCRRNLACLDVILVREVCQVDDICQACGEKKSVKISSIEDALFYRHEMLWHKSLSVRRVSIVSIQASLCAFSYLIFVFSDVTRRKSWD